MPATVVAGAAALGVAVLFLVFDRTLDRHIADAIVTAMFLSGAGTFALAMRWDLSDRNARPGVARQARHAPSEISIDTPQEEPARSGRAGAILLRH